MQKGEPSRTLTQFQYTDWPDHGVPEHAVSLLTIRNAVRRTISPDEYIVVHCRYDIYDKYTSLPLYRMADCRY